MCTIILVAKFVTVKVDIKQQQKDTGISKGSNETENMAFIINNEKSEFCKTACLLIFYKYIFI